MSALEIQRHLDEFTENGFTIIPGGHPPAWVAKARERHAGICARQGAPGQPVWSDNLLELDPELGLEAITRARILAVAEAIIGPHLQVESITFQGAPPTDPRMTAAGLLPGWHRDLFAAFPEAGAYQRPLLFNAMTYLQDLTDAVGPLHVIPGSHRKPIRISAEQKFQHHPEQLVLHPRAGDAVLFHHALLHSGSSNRSDQMRYFYCVTFNHCWLKHRSSYQGPACQAIINQARARGDRRLLRLLGADEHVLTRALYHHVLEPEQEVWAAWQAEDRSWVPGQAWTPVVR